MTQDGGAFLDLLHERLCALLGETEARAAAWTPRTPPETAPLACDDLVRQRGAGLQERWLAQQERWNELDEQLALAEGEALARQRGALAARQQLAEWSDRAVQ